MKYTLNRILHSLFPLGRLRGVFLLPSFFFLLSTSFSQEQFNVTYPHEFSPNALTVFILEDTGYATVGAAIINNWGISITIANEYGNITESKYYDKDNWNIYPGKENSSIKVENKYYLSGYVAHSTGDIHNPYDSAYIYLYVLSESFDSLKTYTFLHDTAISAVYGMCSTHDKGFLIVGDTKRKDSGALVYGNSHDAFMFKIDSLGQEEWYKTFGRNTSDQDGDEFYQVVQTPDKGYLCAGYTKSWQTQDFSDKGDWWLVKTDSLGVEQWSRQYGHPDYNDGRPYGLIMSSDTSYYVVGNRVLLQNGNDLETKCLLKLDSDFNDVYIKYYGAPSYSENTMSAIIENSQGELILGGYRRLFSLYNGYGIVGQLYKLNSDGDSIWRREYTCIDTTNTQNYPFSIKQTSDGGYVFTGIAYDSHSLSPAQQVLLVKTDQYGCDGNTEFWDCDTNVGVSEYVSNPTFSVSPNPAKESFVINIPAKAVIPCQTIEIYDLTGKQVQVSPLERGLRGVSITSHQIDISQLEKGVYILKIGHETQKLIIDN